MPLLPSLLLPGVVAPDRIISMSQIEQSASKQMTDVELSQLDSNTCNHLHVREKSSGSFKNVIYKMCL